MAVSLVPQECAVCKAKADRSAQVSVAMLRAMSTGDGGNEKTELCLRHFVALAREASFPTGALLRNKQIKRLLRLRDELRDYAHKSTWNYRGETWGGERDSWRRVIDLFVGAE